MAIDQEKNLELIKVSHAALDKADKRIKELEGILAKAAALVPKAVEQLVKHFRIDPEAREKAASALGDPASALEILINVADPTITVKPQPLGKAAASETVLKKQADYSHSDDVRRPWNERESVKKSNATLGIS